MYYPHTAGCQPMVQLYRTLPGDGCCVFGCQERFSLEPEASSEVLQCFLELDLCCRSQVMQDKVVTSKWVTLKVTALDLNVTAALCINFLLSLVKLGLKQWELCLKQGNVGFSKVIWDLGFGCFLSGPFCSKFHLGRDYESLPRNPLSSDTPIRSPKYSLQSKQSKQKQE